ncbi:hypothetical protein [Prevotella intermedia]|uniref:Uncharacterized protein n=1 Tax=Prevotella intermedia TaxID=28131 RepID=A0A2M8TWG5_PREIN|nr:hypothetical protein [Prevotella intermedia]PJI28250.1 hypothetical protein CTM58_09300 [Prevotella intermedia]
MKTNNNSAHSPKNKFYGTIYQAGISGSGDTLSLSSNDLEALKGWLEKEAKGKAAQIIIKENKAAYPLFDWKEIENYEINK